MYNKANVTDEQNYYNVNFLVLKPEHLSENYRNEKFQLVLCRGGFGCNPENTGKSVGYSWLDGDRVVGGRDYFYGAASKETIIDWCKKFGNDVTDLSGDFQEALSVYINYPLGVENVRTA